MILFIDDEKRYIQNVIEELKILELEVTFCGDVDEALEIIAKDAKRYKCIICDVMMPYGRAFQGDETADNLTTGLAFLAKIRSAPYYVDCPVILLTYLRPDRAPVDETAKKYPPCLVIRKEDKRSFEIAEEVQDFLARTNTAS